MYMCVHVYISMYLQEYGCLWRTECVCAHACVNIHIFACKYACGEQDVCVCEYLHMSMWRRGCVYVCVHVFISIYLHVTMGAFGEQRMASVLELELQAVNYEPLDVAARNQPDVLWENGRCS